MVASIGVSNTITTVYDVPDIKSVEYCIQYYPAVFDSKVAGK